MVLQSFQDLERGLGERAPLHTDTNISPGTGHAPSRLGSHLDSVLTGCFRSDSDLKFKALARGVSIQIHKINANVQAINKLVQLLGSNKDTPDLRHKLSVVAKAVARRF